MGPSQVQPGESETATRDMRRMDDIGVDATRWFMLWRSHDTTVDLDLELARRQSSENPVYYVQYAHARIAGILRKAGKEAERAVVTAKLLGEQKGDKVKVFKYKNKSGYARRSGHRQLLTLVEIEDVSLGAPARKVAPKKTEAEEPQAEVAEAAGDAAAETPAGE